MSSSPQTSTPSLDEQLEQLAESFSHAIAAQVENASKEEDIRIAVAGRLALIQDKLGIELSGKHEFTVASGRADSVYDRVVIEYKNPASPNARLGATLASKATKAVVDQIKSRLHDLGKEYGHPPASLLGVGMDGRRLVFVRYEQGAWDAEEPVDLTPHSAKRLLWALFNLGRRGKPFTPRYLSEDFGTASALAKEGIRTLYETLLGSVSARTNVLFSQWKILFAEVCGYDVENPSTKLRELGDSYGIDDKSLKPAELLYAIHTYYALFMKLLAAEVIAFVHDYPTPRQGMLKADTSNKLRAAVEELEGGGIFRHLGISNFLEGDLFDWYLSEWRAPVDTLVRRMVSALDEYNPGTLSERPAVSRDLLKKLYHQLFPRTVRHALGEYYTPDWLADLVIDEIGYKGALNDRVLDPACGSGTFLVSVINRVRASNGPMLRAGELSEKDLCNAILNNVIGFDLNPIAVLAARTNFLIAIRDLLPHVAQVELPIYLCDSVLTPLEYGDLFTGGGLGGSRTLDTAVGQFLIPSEIAVDRSIVAKYAEQLEACIRNNYSFAEFQARLGAEGIPNRHPSHLGLYEKVQELNKSKRNGIWARIIKNAFAPLFVGSFDYVLGNPPWVNWESLPRKYREATAGLWQEYSLFQHKGYKAKLGGAKDDISILMTYAAHDRYLKAGGRLGFVITQTVFKTKGGGEGFRRFYYQRDRVIWHIAPLRVHDLSSFQPFEGANNRTSVVIAGKGRKPLKYPVRYITWKKLPRASVGQDDSLSKVLSKTTQRELDAVPVDEAQPTSPWLTAPGAVLSVLRHMVGISDFTPRKGVYCATNAVFWLTEITSARKGEVLVTNLADTGKTRVRRVTQAVEEDYVYSLVRGRDVGRWRWNSQLHILLPQDPAEPSKAIPESDLKVKCPKTFAYLRQYEKQLRACALLKQFFDPKKDPFYSSYNVGSYTFSPYKVVWKEISREIEAAVIHDPNGTIVPDHKLVAVSYERAEPAHFLCAVLNSAPVRLFVRAYTTQTSISGHISGFAKIPSFDKANPSHIDLVKLSKDAHSAAARGRARELEVLNAKLDEASLALWELDRSSLDAIYAELALHGGEPESGENEEED